MNIITKIKRHAAVAGGNFALMFKDTDDIPPLPAAAARLVAEINRPEPEIVQLEKILSTTPGLAAKIIKTVNSSLFALRSPVTTIRHALSMLGLNKIREIALAYTVMDAMPKPKGGLFDEEAFWIDSLIMAMLAKSLTRKFLPGQEEEAFVAALLSDLAVPVLLSAWHEYYAAILDEWNSGPARLCEIERKQFKWDHGQAGAWIAKSWNFSEEMICYIGAHNLVYAKITEYELEETLVLPVSIASMVPSILKPDPQHADRFIAAAVQMLGIARHDLTEDIHQVKESFHEIRKLFELPDRNADQVFHSLVQAIEDKGEPA